MRCNMKRVNILMGSQPIEISTTGKHRLVSEKHLADLVAKNSHTLLHIPEEITVSFLLKYYRFVLFDLQKQELSNEASINIGQISNIENGRTKPQKKTIIKLAKVFGEDFLKLATLIQTK